MRSLLPEVQKLREERNKSAKEVAMAKPEERKVLIDKGKTLKIELDKKEEALKNLQDSIKPLILAIPNPPKQDVKIGKNDTENDVVKKYKEPTKFSFKAKDHLTLGEALGIIDVQRASKVSGSRFYYLKGDAVLLQFALQHIGT